MQARNYNPQKAHGLSSISINRNHLHPLNRSKQSKTVGILSEIHEPMTAVCFPLQKKA